MKIKKRVLPALAFSLFAAFGATQAQSAEFTNVIVFGDSLSDAGYFRGFLRGVGVPQSLVDQMGRFTTNPGLAWSDLVAQFYGVTPKPSNVSGGTIYAQGGARIAGTPGVNTPTGQAERPISTQIGEYLAATGGRADPNALYAVWGGANDVFFNLGAFSAGAITQTQLQTNVLGAATAEIQQIARLQAAGARYIMVFTLPDIGATPAFSGSPVSGSISALAAGYNTTLFTGLASAGIRVIPVDAAALFAEVRATPAAFGFTNVTTAACGAFPPFTTAATANSLFCNSGTLVAAGADQSYAFADGVHPTTAAHRIIAQLAESMIEGPTQHSMLAEAALRTRDAHIRAIGDGVITARQSDVGRWNVFAGGDRSWFDVEAGRGNRNELESTSAAGTVGVTARISEAVTLGGAYGYSRNVGRFGADAGGFRTKENTWSVFGSMKWVGFYATAVLSLADIEFNNIHRNVRLGNDLRRASARTEGSNGSAQVTLGYDFPVARLTIGPTVSVTTQNVDVNGFDEAGAGVVNLRIAEQKRRSEVWSGGVRASYNMDGWTPWIRVTADKERRDDARFVTATPLTMAAIGSSYDIPAYQSDTDFTTIAFGVNGRITDRIGLGVNAFKVTGRSGISESGVNAMVSLKF